MYNESSTILKRFVLYKTDINSLTQWSRETNNCFKLSIDFLVNDNHDKEVEFYTHINNNPFGQYYIKPETADLIRNYVLYASTENSNGKTLGMLWRIKNEFHLIYVYRSTIQTEV